MITVMGRFASYDGTVLAYRRAGRGAPLVCLPGGPGLTPDYLGDLGGLGRSAGRELVMLEPRGTGGSAMPDDPASYRCDRQVEDVEALRGHLGLELMDLLAHSAAAGLALLYAARHPGRLGRLILLTPILRVVGILPADDEYWTLIARRSGEPWYPVAREALVAADKGADTLENRLRFAPFFYGRWDEVARAHAEIEFGGRAPAAEAGYYPAEGFDADAIRAALAGVSAPVLVYAGELDFAPSPDRAADAARLFPRGELVIQPSACHAPWLDDPGWFATAVARFLWPS